MMIAVTQTKRLKYDFWIEESYNVYIHQNLHFEKLTQKLYFLSKVLRCLVYERHSFKSVEINLSGLKLQLEKPNNFKS